MTAAQTEPTPIRPGIEALAYWPRLTWFYGLAPSEIEQMPNALIKLYLQRIPELQAESQLMAIEAASFPYFEERDSKRIHRHYVRQLEPVTAAEQKQASLPDEAALAAIGIPVVRKQKAQEVAQADA